MVLLSLRLPGLIVEAHTTDSLFHFTLSLFDCINDPSQIVELTSMAQKKGKLDQELQYKDYLALQKELR